MVEIFNFKKVDIGDEVFNPWYGWMDVVIKYDKIVIKRDTRVFEINVNGMCPSYGLNKKFIYAMRRKNER